MLDFLSRNTDSIILSFIFLILGGITAPLFASLFSKKEHSNNSYGAIRLTQIIQIDNSTNNTYNNYRGRRKESSSDDMHVIYLGMAAAVLGYIYYREEILLTITSVSFFSIGLLVGACLYASYHRLIDGTAWTLYLILTLMIMSFTFVLIDGALYPEYAPAGLDSLQTIFREQKLAGLIKALHIETISWLVTHVFGIVILFFIQIRLSLSLGHYLSVVNLATSVEPWQMTIWFYKKTKRYQNPLENSLILLGSCAAAYVLINGIFYMWFMTLFKS